MEIEYRKIGDLKPYERNAKEHTKKQVQKIADSIREFGFNRPLVVDKDYVIIVGHGAYAAAQLLGMEEVPVLKRADLTDQQANAYRLADNKLNESEWEMELVLQELKLLPLQLVDLTGFDANLILETKEDKPDLSTVGTPKSKLGDIYDLGEHRLICGDSEKQETYEKLLGEERARMIFTDPPYSIDYLSGAGISYNSEKFGGTGGRIFNDDKTPSEALEFYKRALEQIHAFSTADATIYWWYASRLTDVNMDALFATNWHMSQICVWLKNSLIFSPGQLFNRIKEFCMVGWKVGESPYQNRAFSSFTELWTLDKKSFADYLDAWYNKRDSTAKYIHPTQKPVQLAERAIKRSSEKGDVVLDAFAGSGSTMIACEQLGRRCRLIELDPKYVDAIVSRWVKYIENTRIIKNGEEVVW